MTRFMTFIATLAAVLALAPASSFARQGGGFGGGRGGISAFHSSGASFRSVGTFRSVGNFRSAPMAFRSGPLIGPGFRQAGFQRGFVGYPRHHLVGRPFIRTAGFYGYGGTCWRWQYTYVGWQRIWACGYPYGAYSYPYGLGYPY
jgi:hypothetical protein